MLACLTQENDENFDFIRSCQFKVAGFVFGDICSLHLDGIGIHYINRLCLQIQILFIMSATTLFCFHVWTTDDCFNVRICY